jgi:hypothetical protein
MLSLQKISAADLHRRQQRFYKHCGRGFAAEVAGSHVTAGEDTTDATA